MTTNMVTIFWFLAYSTGNSKASGGFGEVLVARDEMAEELEEQGYTVEFRYRKRVMIARDENGDIALDEGGNKMVWRMGRVQLPYTSL